MPQIVHLLSLTKFVLQPHASQVQRRSDAPGDEESSAGIDGSLLLCDPSITEFFYLRLMKFFHPVLSQVPPTKFDKEFFVVSYQRTKISPNAIIFRENFYWDKTRHRHFTRHKTRHKTRQLGILVGIGILLGIKLGNQHL